MVKQAFIRISPGQKYAKLTLVNEIFDLHTAYLQGTLRFNKLKLKFTTN